MSNLFPIKFAHGRSPCFPAGLGLPPDNEIERSWSRTAETLSAMQECLAKGVPQAVSCIAVSGSLGRMEQGPFSDCDLIVVLHEDVCPNSFVGRSAFEAVWQPLQPLQLGTPKPNGIFASATRAGELCRPTARGQIDEDLGVFGKRIQMLLDCQPIFGHRNYDQLLDDVVKFYVAGPNRVQQTHPYAYLLNDLSRYFRSLRVRAQWTLTEHPGKWWLQNMKLRHSRLVLYSGLLLLIGEGFSQTERHSDWLSHRLRMTPLERIAYVYDVCGNDNFSTIADCYCTFLSALGDPKFRRELLDVTDRQNADMPTEIPWTAELTHNAPRLTADLSRFLWLQQGRWGSEFYEQFVF